MSKSARSLWFFSLYMFALGGVLVVAPNRLLSVFGLPQTHEVWIRVVGMLALIVAYFDFMAARSELRAFIRWSVAARLSVPVFFLAFVALGLAPPILVLFGAVDAVAAIWTAVCLRDDGSARPGAPAGPSRSTARRTRDA